MNNILISSAGRRVSLVKAFQKELKLIWPKAKVICSDVNPNLSAACQVADAFFQVPLLNEENYGTELIQKCKEYGISLIIPTLDTELLILSNIQAKLTSLGIKIVLSNANFINSCRDKRATNELFCLLGISIPKAINPYFPTFPLFIKPFNGSLSKGILTLEKEADLNDELISNPDLMFMEYLSPVDFDEYTVDMYFDRNHALKCLVPRKRLEIRGGEISKGITKKNKLFDFLISKFSILPGAIGCINVQFFVSKTEDDKIFGIEINPRFGGGFPLSYEAGANYPKIIIKEFLQNKFISYFDNWKENILMLRFDAEIIIDGV